MVQPDVAHHPDSHTIGAFAGAPPVPGETAPSELLFDAADAAGGGAAGRPGA
ncbi:MAG TPA: hypothetical protein VLA98_09145 [Solirubrobacteraceae bacterium]|nr:hypothetical protein [Solirubrobacteraceae bacterium]